MSLPATFNVSDYTGRYIRNTHPNSYWFIAANIVYVGFAVVLGGVPGHKINTSLGGRPRLFYQNRPITNVVELNHLGVGGQEHTTAVCESFVGAIRVPIVVPTIGR